MRRHKHTLSYYNLLSCDMGELVPVGLHEALPGDTWQLSTDALIRVSPLAAPVMHPVRVRIHHFFVPNRILWDDWEDFITGGMDGNQTPSLPTVTGGSAGQITDYMGIDPQATSVNINALPVRAYNHIWNEYYRDQDLQTERTISDKSMANICWEKDYFSSARPWTQKGDDVTLPTGSKAPVKGIGAATQVYQASNQTVYETGESSSSTFNPWRAFTSTYPTYYEEDPDNPGFPNIYADLSSATAINVNDFRRAFALQRYKEARARYGSRYTEYLRYLGVTPSDARLQRPEYLGGGQSMINFSEVLQTGSEATVGDTGYGVGDMYGHGIAAMRTNKVRRFIEEHGYIMSLLSVRPRAMYIQAVDRHWLKTTKEDYYQKELEYIGQQPITKNEIYPNVTDGTDTWGYVDRYREYRETHSKVSGNFRSTLDYWHMGRDIGSSVALNSDFVECTPTKRIHNVQTEDTLWVMINNHAVARRLVGRSAYARIL